MISKIKEITDQLGPAVAALTETRLACQRAQIHYDWLLAELQAASETEPSSTPYIQSAVVGNAEAPARSQRKRKERRETFEDRAARLDRMFEVVVNDLREHESSAPSVLADRVLGHPAFAEAKNNRSFVYRTLSDGVHAGWCECSETGRYTFIPGAVATRAIRSYVSGNNEKVLAQRVRELVQASPGDYFRIKDICAHLSGQPPEKCNTAHPLWRPLYGVIHLMVARGELSREGPRNYRWANALTATSFPT
jgi:hypothetical protein